MGSIPVNTEETKVGSNPATPTKKPLLLKRFFFKYFFNYSSTQSKTLAYSVGSKAL